jgi:hypothetical protein
MRGLAGTAAALLLALATTHCSGLESAHDTYGSVHPVDPADHSSPWWCDQGSDPFMSVVPPPTYSTPPASSARVRYDLPIYDFQLASGGKFSPVTVIQSLVGCPGVHALTACLDGGAVIPYAVAPPVSTAGYQIDLPYNFDGAIALTAAGYMPTEYFLGGPLLGTAGTDGGPMLDKDGTPVVMGQPIAPILYDTLDELFSGVTVSGVTAMRDPTKGLLVARLLDCNGMRAGGVVLEIQNFVPSDGLGFTLVNGGYIPQGGQPPPPTEPGRGVSGYANMPPSDYRVDAIAPSGRHYGLTSVTIVANVLTLLEIRTDNQHIVAR